MNAPTTDTQRRLMSSIHALLDGSLEATDRAALEAQLDADPAARQTYIRCVDLHCEIADVLHTTPLEDEPLAPVGRVGSSGGRFVVGFAVALAAMITIAAAAVVVYLQSAPAPTIAPAPRPMIATVIEATGSLYVGDDIAVPGSDYAAEPVSLVSGTAEFQLTSGANIRLRGRSRMTLQGTMRAKMFEGSATFTCPESAHGFAVTLPTGAKVIDLGTVFRVRVIDATRCVVSVLEGSVRIDHDAAGPHTLAAGSATTVTRDGIEPLAPPTTPTREWLATAETPGEIAQPFEGIDLSEGLTIGATFRVDDPARWDGTHIWSIFRRESPDRALLAIQLPRNMGEHGPAIGGSGYPGIAFGLITGSYVELDIALDGQEGRPKIESLLDGAVHHIAAVYDRKAHTMTVYLDGEAIGSRNTEALGDLRLAADGEPATIGAFGDNENFDGQLLSVAVYDRPLSEREVAQRADWRDVETAPRPDESENSPAPGARSSENEKPESKGATR